MSEQKIRLKESIQLLDECCTEVKRYEGLVEEGGKRIADLDRRQRLLVGMLTKATKNDDAEVLVYLWNESIVADGDPRKLLALDVIRHFALRWWKKNTTRDFLRWLNQKYPLALRPSGGYKKRTERLVLTACLDVQILHGGNRMWDLSLYSGGGLRNTGQLYVME